MGARFPGQQRIQTQKSFCGIKYRDGYSLKYLGQTLGVGYIIEDQDGIPAVQVVDQTLYLLIPFEYTERFPADNGNLFQRVIMTYWNGLVAPRPESGAVAISSEKDFFDVLQARNLAVEESTRQMVEEHRVQVEKLRSDLRVALNGWRLFAEMENALIADAPNREGRNGMAAERGWHRLMSRKDVASVSYLEKGVELTTKRLYPVHEGVTYVYPGYVIRISDSGAIFIRCIGEPLQGKYVHPHVSSRSCIPCFGNATSLIMEETTKVDPTQAFILILNWLVEGYDPMLADTKIELWPRATIEEVEEHA